MEEQLVCHTCGTEFEFSVPEGAKLIKTVLGIRLSSFEGDPYPPPVRCPGCNNCSKVCIKES